MFYCYYATMVNKDLHFNIGVVIISACIKG